MHPITKRLSFDSSTKQGIWVVGGMVASQLIRLVGNLILTRLLFPEAFGLVALASAIIIGVGMLSDVGLRGAVLKSERSNDPIFMETVWTIQMLRGVILAVIILVAAPLAAKLYNEPLLSFVLPLLAVNTIILGAKSIALFTYDKKLALRKQVIVDLGTQLFGAVCMISWAYFSPNVWALIAGSIITTALGTLSSYFLFEGHHSRFRFETSAVSEIIGFGKWVFFSTAIGYVANQGDKLIMGAWLTMGELGIYSIAAVLASVPNLFIGNLSNRFLQPLFRKHIDGNNEWKIAKLRLKFNFVLGSACCVIAWLGQIIVDIMYDERYEAAGWMLQLLAIRSLGFCLNATLTPYLLAKGDSYSQFKYQILNTAYLVVGMILGAQISSFGIILAYACGPVLCHPFLVQLTKKHKLPELKFDIILPIFFTFLICLGWFFIDAPIIDQLSNFAAELYQIN